MLFHLSYTLVHCNMPAVGHQGCSGGFTGPWGNAATEPSGAGWLPTRWKWHHYALTYSGNQAATPAEYYIEKLFLDGQLMATYNRWPL